MIRRRRSRRLWPLLSIAAAGALGAVAVLLLTREDGELAGDLELDPELETELGPTGEPDEDAVWGDESPSYAEPAPVADVAVWIAGPAGNLFVRDGGTGAGLPVLFVHSLGGNGGQWALQLDHLRRRRRAAALDLRGHGDSDPADSADYSVAALAADIAAVADQLGLRRFVLAGHSLGGAVAIEYASRHPERVAGLFLADPNGDQTLIPAAQLEPFLAAVRADPLHEMASYFRQILVGGDPAVAGWVLEDLQLTDEHALLGALEAVGGYSPLPALRAYPGPKLSVVSDMNSLPFSLHNLLPDLSTRLLPGTGHWLMMDNPEPFNRILDEFLFAVDAIAAGESRES